MKENPICIGFDDAKFELHSNTKTTQLIGVICQGTRMMKTVRNEIQIDGYDATEKLINLVQENRNHVQYILTDTITFGGFNIINLETIFNETGKPIIAITEKEVDLELVKNAIMKKFTKDYRKKILNVIKAGNLFETKIPTAGGISKVYFHSKGISHSTVFALLQKICIDSKAPEPVRLAHLIGRLF